VETVRDMLYYYSLNRKSLQAFDRYKTDDLEWPWTAEWPSLRVI